LEDSDARTKTLFARLDYDLDYHRCCHLRDLWQRLRAGAVPRTVTVGKLSVTVPGDVQSRKDQSEAYFRSASFDGNIIVSYREAKDGEARPRLTAFLQNFIASYGSVDHVVSIQEGECRGMSISTEVYHDRSMMRYTYVESRVVASPTNIFYVTVETEVAPNKPLHTETVTQIITSMKVTK
jgi:hypothetical protein